MSELFTEEQPTTQSTTDNSVDARRRAFLLWQLLQATPHHRLSKGEANRIPSERKRQLDLTPSLANQLREELISEGFIRIEKEGRSIFYVLTDEGREHLQGLPLDWVDVPEDDPFAEIFATALPYVRPYLLLQIARKDPEPVKKGDVNRFDVIGEKELGLKASLANRLRQAMAREGLIEIEKSSRSESYRITPEGLEHLALNDQFPAGEYRIPGQLWNRLQALAKNGVREQATSPPVVEESSPPMAAAVPSNLPEVVFSAFEVLLREQYAHVGLVPIHAVRQIIRTTFGEEAASHAVFDEAVRQLQRVGQIYMIPLDHGGDVSDQEIRDSIKAMDRIFFYMERRDG